MWLDAHLGWSGYPIGLPDCILRVPWLSFPLPYFQTRRCANRAQSKPVTLLFAFYNPKSIYRYNLPLIHPSCGTSYSVKEVE